MKSISLKKSSDRKTHLIKAPGMGQGGGSREKKQQIQVILWYWGV